MARRLKLAAGVHSDEQAHRQSLRPRLVTALAMSLLACGIGGCVNADAESSTGLVRKAPRLETLTLAPAVAVPVTLGLVDVGVREVTRMATRGSVVAMQVGTEIVLLDLASAQARAGQPANDPVDGPPQTLAISRVGSRTGTAGPTIELMYGPTQAGFAVLVTPPPALANQSESAAIRVPVPAWLDDDGSLRLIRTGLPNDMGVQCWVPLSPRGDVLLLAASVAGQAPRLWISTKGQCVAFGNADGTTPQGNSVPADGYFVLVPSGDGSLFAAVRQNRSGVFADMFDVAQRSRLFVLQLDEYGARSVPVGRGGWGSSRAARTGASLGDVSGDIGGPQSIEAVALAVGPMQWSGIGGVAYVPLRSIDDGASRLYSRHTGSAVRLPLQSGSVCQWNRFGVVVSAMGWGPMPATQSVIAPGAWALELLAGAEGDETAARVGGVWSVSGDSALAMGQEGGSILVFQRHAPGQSIVQTVQVR